MKETNKCYSKLTKPMDYPIGIKDYIYSMTDYRTNRTLKISRFVSTLEMYEGKPLERIFGFISSSSKRTKETMLIKEVARNYDHKQWLGDIYMSSYMGYKKPEYKFKKDRFCLTKSKWHFNYCYSMITPNDFLQKYDIKYSGWTIGSDLEFIEYITTYLENPKCELFMKAGLGYWTKYLSHLDLNKKSLHEIFKINQECVPLLQDKKFGYKELMICRKYGYTTLNEINTKIAINHLCRKERYYGYKYDNYIMDILKSNETFKYLVKYKFVPKYRIYDYIDYLKELKELGAINDHKALYPKQFNKAHKITAKQIEKKESQKLISGFTKSYNKYKKYEFKKDNLLIIAVSLPEQLYEESEVLDHCVRTYDEDVAKGKTEIMFVRNAKKPNTPYFTLELKRNKVVQVRGKDNCDPNKKVKDFITNWSKKFKIKYTGIQKNYA